MTAKVIPFVPNAEAAAQENMASFISLAKSLVGSYPLITSWDDNVWDLSDVIKYVGSGKTRVVVTFGDFDTIGESKNIIPMRLPFRDLAKSYFLYKQSFRPGVRFKNRMIALKAIEKSLVDNIGLAEPNAITPAIMNSATNLVRDKYNRASAYSIGIELNGFVKFVSESRLIKTPFQWRHCLPVKERNGRIGAEAEAARSCKMPSQFALDALPKCFLLATAPEDVVASSVAALLCTAPDRIGEVLTLPVDCEVEQEMEGKKVYGLRWWPRKGAEPMIKWISPTMVDVARMAIAKLRALSEPARKVAKWYEDHPGEMYVPEGMEHVAAKQKLTSKDIVDLVGFASIGTANVWLRGLGLPFTLAADGNTRFYKKRDVERAIVGMLPRGFPVLEPSTGLRYSDALLVFRKNEFVPRYATYAGVIEALSTAFFNTQLGSGVAHNKSSMFERMGFTEPDGRPIKVNTHQFRHWLNTLAHRGGLSQLDIAKWSGRKNIHQNVVYDHMTSHELIEMTRSMSLDDPRLFGPLGELAAKTPVTRDEFMELEFPTAHVTEIGFCVHDFTMLPCQRHRDCINCTEHVCVKGDSQKTKRIKEQLALAEDQLRRAREAAGNAYSGADRWSEHQKATVERLRVLAGALEDPSVPEGALIKMVNPNEHSGIRMAFQDRQKQVECGQTGPTFIKNCKIISTLSGGA